MNIMLISYHRNELRNGKLLHYLHSSAKFYDSVRILIKYWLAGKVWPSKCVVSASYFCIKMDLVMLFIECEGGRMICAFQCIRDAWLLMQPSIGVVCNNEYYFVII
jgi:hypothetical protein